MLLFLISPVFSKTLFSCNSTSCNSNWIGDGYCDLVCNTEVCNFDSADNWDSSLPSRFENSDCFWDCLGKGCDPSLLANNICDPECNFNECGFDLGDCGYCSDGCFNTSLLNNICESACDNSLCMFDNDACGWCADGCFSKNLASSICIPQCKVHSCLVFPTNPCISECSPGCFPSMLGNQICDAQCNNAECNYDEGDCICSPGCTPELLADPVCYTSATYTDPCDTFWCGFKNGACGVCADGCVPLMLGNGVCDTKCNNIDCQYDYGDCGCSFGCTSAYDTNTNTWTWDNDADHFQACLVPACLYNYGSSNFAANTLLVREVILTQILFQNWSLTDLQSHPDCTHSSLALFDSGNLCVQSDTCNTLQGLYCMGMVQPGLSNCLRSDGKKCLVCEGYMVMDVCANSLTQCPLGYSDYSGIGSVFGDLNLCLRDPSHLSPNDFLTFYVAPAAYPGTAEGIGSADNPFLSIYYAFTQVYASFTKILLTSGEYHYEVIQILPLPLINDPLNPLKINSFLPFYELWIIGDSNSDRPVVYWHNLLTINSVATKIVVKNIIFNGTQILARTCAKLINPVFLDYCNYCPITITYFGISVDQHYNILPYNFSAMGPQNCSLFSAHNVFNVQNEGNFENVDFYGFREQSNAIILASGSLNLTNVHFNMVQTKAGSSVIQIQCSSKCESTNFWYTSGTVENLNYGYELTDLLELGSFFKTANINSIGFEAVTFQYNLVLSYYGSPQPAAIISILDQIGQISISNCVFDTNYVDSLILVDVSNLIYNDLRPNYLGISQSYGQIHFNMTNTLISNIYSSTDLISYKMQKTVHNIVLNNVKIDNVAAGGNGILCISNTGILTNKENQGATQNILYNNTEMMVSIPYRFLSFSNLIISNSATSYYGIFIFNMPWVNLTQFTMFKVYDNSISSNNIIDIFSNSGAYFSAYPGAGQTVELTCLGTVFISNTYNLFTNTIEVHDTDCGTNSGTSALRIDQILNLITLVDTNLHDINSQSSSGLVLFVSNINYEITIINLRVVNVINQDGSIIEFSNPYSFKLIGLTITNISSYNVSPFFIDQVISIYLENFNILNSISQYGNGGCLNIVASRITNADGQILNGYLNGCYAPYGYGGGIMLDSIASINSWNLQVSNLTLINCHAIDGSVLFITNECTFNPSTNFSYIVIHDNSATLSIISDNHMEGPLVLTNVHLHNNYANVVGISTNYLMKAELLYIFNMTISDSYGSLTFSLSSQNTFAVIFFENVIISNIYASNGFADAFLINKLTFFGTNIEIFQMNNAMKISSVSNIVLNNVKAFNISENFLIAIDGVAFSCNYCSVHNILSTVISAATNCSLNLSNSVFFNNTVSSTSPAIISISNSNKLQNYISNCSFVNNLALISDLFEFTMANFVITDSEFRKNYAPNSTNSGIYLYQSNLKTINCVFTDQSSKLMAAFLYITWNSQVNLTNSLFHMGSAYLGGAVYISDSLLGVYSSKFDSNLASDFGGSIFADNSPVILENTTFTNCNSYQGTDIYISGGSLTISKSTFVKSITKSSDPTSSVYITGTNLIIDQTQFKDPLSKVSALIVNQASTVVVSNSKFKGISGTGAGAIALYGSSQKSTATFSNCVFENNNSTVNGGAIYVTDMSLSIKNSLVTSNYASNDGGGVFFQSPSCQGCSFTVESSTFTNNTCLHNGGAISWLHYRPNIDVDTVISNNSASYGSNLASAPCGLSTKTSRSLKSGFVFDHVAPGQNLTDFLLISEIDTYGNIIYTDSSSVLYIIPDPAYPYLSLSGTLEFVANKGVFNVTNFIASAPPGSVQQFKAQNPSITTSRVSNDESTYQDTVMVELRLRNCTFGEEIGLITCTLCPETKYLIYPDYQCLKCPDGALCPGGDLILPQAGYWRSSNLSSVVYSCPAFSACLGNTSLSDYTGTCATGYYSVKCGACLGGFTLSSQNTCSACPGEVQNIFILTLLILGVFFVCVILVKSTIKSAFKVKSLHSVYIKIFTNYIQLVFLTSQFNLQWPSYIITMFNSNKQVASSSDSIFSVDCYVASKNSGNPVNSYFYKLVLYSLLPFIIFFISFVIWLGVAFTKTTFACLKKELPLTLIVVFFLFYPNIVKFMFANFACENIDLMGDYLTANFAIKCWDQDHTKYSYIVAIPSIIAWAFGLPFVILTVMAKRKKYLSRPNNKVIFGFLYNGYREAKFYWEFVIMYRKIIMISVAVFTIQVSTNVQALIIVVVLIVSVYFQYEFKPFNSSELNHMELEALMTATLTLYCGLFYITNQIGAIFELVLFVLIAIGNGYFVAYWIYWMCLASLDIILKAFPNLKYYLKKGDAFEEDFSSEIIQRKGIFFDFNEGENAYTFLSEYNGHYEKKKKLIKLNDLEVTYKDVFVYEHGGLEGEESKKDDSEALHSRHCFNQNNFSDTDINESIVSLNYADES